MTPMLFFRPEDSFICTHQALLRTQERWRSFMPNFTFHLGFSGHASAGGTTVKENKGASLLISKHLKWHYLPNLPLENRHKFKWTCHTWNHVGLENLTELEITDQLLRNKAFAESNDLPIAKGYAISPRHAGVYPIVPHFYRAWKSVWNITMTATIQYPHIAPQHKHRGFRYMDIQVSRFHSFIDFHFCLT